MSQIANIVAFDGAATPVSHTFVPISVTRDNLGVVTALWRENLTGVPVYACPSFKMATQKLKSGVYKVDCRVEVPVMESVSGQNAAGYTAAPRVAHVETAQCSFFMHERSDLVGRRLARQLIINILGSIATSVTPVTTGPVPEACDLLVMPT